MNENTIFLCFLSDSTLPLIAYPTMREPEASSSIQEVHRLNRLINVVCLCFVHVPLLILFLPLGLSLSTWSFWEPTCLTNETRCFGYRFVLFFSIPCSNSPAPATSKLWFLNLGPTIHWLLPRQACGVCLFVLVLFCFVLFSDKARSRYKFFLW